MDEKLNNDYMRNYKRAWRKAGRNKKFRGHCLACGKALYAEKKTKYCNNICQGVIVSKMFKGKPKHYKVWNAGTKGLCKPNQCSFKKGEHKSVGTEFVKGELVREKHYNWQGGISAEPYPFDFGKALKELIKKRDGYKCRICGNGNVVLSVHHIDYKKDNLSPDNLVSLCKPCHGKTNFNRGQWIGYFTEAVMPNAS